MKTPKAFANSSPGFEHCETPGTRFKRRSNPERVRQLANPFRVPMTINISIPGLSLCSNPGLKFANAFGVILVKISNWWATQFPTAMVQTTQENFIMRSFSKIAPQIVMLILAFACALSVQGQITTGSIRGVVTDPNGAVVPSAKVTITKRSNNSSLTTQTSGTGQFEFNNLLVRDDYPVTVEASNFKALTLTDVKVQLNHITDLAAQLSLGIVGEMVTVTSAGAELVDTTTATLSKSFNERQVVDLAQTNVGGAF